MTVRIIGAAMLMAGSSGFGIALAAHSIRQKQLLQQLSRIVSEMQWELTFRLTPLPELCRQASGSVHGELKSIFQELGNRLDRGWDGDVSGCMNALASRPELPRAVRRCLRELGSCLGRFDLEGQIEGLKAVNETIRQELDLLNESGKERIRSYQTLALCAGAALVILLI